MQEDVQALFRELADLPPDRREELYGLRNVPASVRAELESLLSFDEEPGDSMTDVVGSAAEEFLLANAPVSEGGRCGPYRLLRMLGNGGMGEVYLAERADGELEHQVAIKFVRTGADMPSFRERFMRERQILASLNHPGIARLLDAGHAFGHPYLVMEYVNGTRIDEYSATLSEREVLQIIMRVADAVAYAHRNLIIHCDLKPSNILIDANGHPKLLDFGIAKILDSPDETRTLVRMLTPEYASPEQLRGDAQTTATDVYSLGAVLQRLLTGQSPQPSTQPRREGLPKDLAAILSKAMREEPEERYASVDLFQADIEAYLGHRPVQALKGNAWYLARKFLRRRWLPIAAVSLAVLGLSAGLLIANRERAIAQHRFQQVRQLSQQFFELDAEIRSLPGSTKARNRIVAASLQYLERLGAEASLTRWGTSAAQDADLSLDIAAAYLQVARVQGVPGASNLGQFAQARQSLARADKFVESVLADPAFPRRRSALFTSAEITHDAMILADTEGRADDALALAARAASRLEALLRAQGPDKAEALKASRIFTNVSMTYQKQHQLDKSVDYARRSVDISRRFGTEPRVLSLSLGVLANSARFAGDFDTALTAIRESRSIAEQTADRNDVARTLMLSAALYREGIILGELNNISLDRPQEAIPLLRRSLDLADSMAERDPNDYTSRTYVSMAGRELGDILRGTDPAQALAIYDHTRSRLSETSNPKTRRDQVWVLTGASYALRRLHRSEESNERIQSAFAILRDLHLYPATQIELGEESDAAMRALADHYSDTGQTGAAINTYQELRDRVQASHPQPRTDLRHANGLSRIYRDLGGLHRKAGHTAEARTLDQLRLELWRYWDQRLPNNPFVRRQLADARAN